MSITFPAHLSDADLIAELQSLARCEREATAQLIAHLAVLDARRLYLGAGFPSLFAYCCEVLGLSEHEAYSRIEAARAARRFPTVLERLAGGAVNLTTVRLLAPHLTPENHERLLAAAAHKTKREVEELLAEEFPRPDVCSTIRRLPAPDPRPLAVDAAAKPAAPITAAESVAAHEASTLQAGRGGDGQRQSQPIGTTPARPALIAPLAPDRYEIRFTASAATRDKLRRAQDLLRHAVPRGDPAEVIDRALTALLDDLARKKLAATERPRNTDREPSPDSRHIPARVRRAVWLRDGGRCAFTSGTGRRCQARGFLEFHHVRPFATGGTATTANIQLRCRAHNSHEADVYFAASATMWLSGLCEKRAPHT